MLSVGMPGENKFGKLRVFGRVAGNAQHLNVCRVGAKARLRTVRFDVVPLQIFFAAALFALVSFANNLTYQFSTVVFSLACAALPIWVVWAFRHSCFSAAFCRTVFTRATAPFAYFKLFFARFADTLQKGLLFARAQFLRAFSRTGVCCSSDVGVGPCKNIFASGTCQSSVPAPFNCSLEFSHG